MCVPTLSRLSCELFAFCVRTSADLFLRSVLLWLLTLLLRLPRFGCACFLSMSYSLAFERAFAMFYVSVFLPSVAVAVPTSVLAPLGATACLAV